MSLARTLALLVLASSSSAQQADTIFAEVGSPAIDGRVFKPHAARVRIYRGDSLVAQWLNELTLGDSAGRPVMRWVTTGEVARDNPSRPLAVLRQTYDAVTLAPLGYSSTSNTGAFAHASIDGLRVTGRRRTAADTTAILPIDITLQRRGFFAGASDLVPAAAGLRTGSVIVAPLWSLLSATPDYRVFVVLRDTTLSIEGATVRARKVEERKRSDGSLTANWYLLTEAPYMVYGEVPLADGRVQRMTEVPAPMLRPTTPADSLGLAIALYTALFTEASRAMGSGVEVVCVEGFERRADPPHGLIDSLQRGRTQVFRPASACRRDPVQTRGIPLVIDTLTGKRGISLNAPRLVFADDGTFTASLSYSRGVTWAGMYRCSGRRADNGAWLVAGCRMVAAG